MCEPMHGHLHAVFFLVQQPTAQRCVISQNNADLKCHFGFYIIKRSEEDCVLVAKCSRICISYNLYN